MPIYEYEPVDRDCAICNGRVEVMQNLNEEPYKYCPWCGLDVVRVVSRASIKLRGDIDPERAAKKGFSTFRRLEKGKWEKVAGPDAEDPISPPPMSGIYDPTKDTD
jgi:putative FmdB family regulatory protein